MAPTGCPREMLEPLTWVRPVPRSALDPGSHPADPSVVPGAGNHGCPELTSGGDSAADRRRAWSGQAVVEVEAPPEPAPLDPLR